MNRLQMAEEIKSRAPLLAKRDKDEWKNAEKLRAKFVADYSSKRILSLTMDEYVIGKGATNRSFCYRIEREMDPLGRITGATAFKFGVYFGRTKKDPAEQYRFLKRWGGNYNDAFTAVKRAIVDLLEAASNDDRDAIRNNRLSPMLKGKILFLYHPHSFAPIYAREHLEHFMAALNLADSVASLTDMQSALMAYRSSWPELMAQHPALYMRLLYDIFGYPDYEEDSVEKDASSPPTVPLLNEAIDGAVVIDRMPVPLNPLSKDSNSSGKTDYEAHHRTCKRIGDRGEAIVFALEQNRLRDAGKSELAQRIRHVSQENDGLGYDILSFEDDGSKRLIEVKATTEANLDRGFYLSNNEFEKAATLSNYYIYLVFSAMTKHPRILRLKKPAFDGTQFILQPRAYHATISNSVEASVSLADDTD
jgi:hypothetical protein